MSLENMFDSVNEDRIGPDTIKQTMENAAKLLGIVGLDGRTGPGATSGDCSMSVADLRYAASMLDLVLARANAAFNKEHEAGNRDRESLRVALNDLTTAKAEFAHLQDQFERQVKAVKVAEERADAAELLKACVPELEEYKRSYRVMAQRMEDARLQNMVDVDGLRAELERTRAELKDFKDGKYTPFEPVHTPLINAKTVLEEMGDTTSVASHIEAAIGAANGTSPLDIDAAEAGPDLTSGSRVAELETALDDARKAKAEALHRANELEEILTARNLTIGQMTAELADVASGNMKLRYRLEKLSAFEFPVPGSVIIADPEHGPTQHERAQILTMIEKQTTMVETSNEQTILQTKALQSIAEAIQNLTRIVSINGR
jgi:hypothetical protein